MIMNEITLEEEEEEKMVAFFGQDLHLDSGFLLNNEVCQVKDNGVMVLVDGGDGGFSGGKIYGGDGSDGYFKCGTHELSIGVDALRRSI